MPRRQKRKLTEKEIHQLEGWSAIRIPFEHMAALLDMGTTDLREAINKNDTIRRAIDQGRAKAKTMVHRTLYERAVGRKAYKNEEGVIVPEIPVDFQALRFWCQTQEQMRTTEKLELSGPEGGPIENTQVSKEELKARLLALRAANDLTDDE